MSELERVRTLPITPIYSQDSVNKGIAVGRIQLAFEHKGANYEDDVQLRLEFSPDDRIEMIVPISGKPSSFPYELLFRNDVFRTTFKAASTAENVEAFAMGMSDDQLGIVFQPTISRLTRTGPTTDIYSVTFHLFNFPRLKGRDDCIFISGNPGNEGFQHLGRVNLRGSGWEITICETLQTSDLIKQLRANGGFALSHVGSIVREDGSAFSNSDLEDLLSCLHYFLTFALGRWAGPVLPVGFDRNGNRVFEQCALKSTADGYWKFQLSWFDSENAEILSEVFPGFMALWNNPLWRTQLTHALYWYCGANDRRVGIGPDTGIILAQTALELLAWNYCVNDRNAVSKAAFGQRGLTAADKIRLLASLLGIPTDIPMALTALRSKSGTPWNDGPEAITAIRNSLVHPDSKTTLPNGAYIDAWKLSLWYIDMTLLRLCGLKGNYSNRVINGAVDQLPWS